MPGYGYFNFTGWITGLLIRPVHSWILDCNGYFKDKDSDAKGFSVFAQFRCYLKLITQRKT